MTKKAFFMLFRVEIDEFSDGLTAHFAKFRVLGGAHPAVGEGAIDTFRAVACTFVNADFSIVEWGRDGRFFVEHRLPFLRETERICA